MRKKTTHSNSSIPKLYHDFTIYRDLKNLQKTTNPYSVHRMSTVKKSRVSSFFSVNPQDQNQIAPKITKISSPNQKKNQESRPFPSISEAKSLEIADMIENQIREDVKHYSQIGELALSSFKEKVSLYNSFFTRYIFENNKDISSSDLVIQPFSLFKTQEKNYIDEGDISPQEKIRRQRNRGSIFCLGKQDSFKLSPSSPRNIKKNMNFKDNFKNNFLQHQNSGRNIMLMKKKQNNTKNEIITNDKKEINKNNWEYLYYLGQSDLIESQEKLQNLRKTLTLNESGPSDPTKIDFFKNVKAGDAHKVKMALLEANIKEKDFPNSKKLVNSVDSYVLKLFKIFFIIGIIIYLDETKCFALGCQKRIEGDGNIVA